VASRGRRGGRLREARGPAIGSGGVALRCPWAPATHATLEALGASARQQCRGRATRAARAPSCAVCLSASPLPATCTPVAGCRQRVQARKSESSGAMAAMPRQRLSHTHARTRLHRDAILGPARYRRRRHLRGECTSPICLFVWPRTTTTPAAHQTPWNTHPDTCTLRGSPVAIPSTSYPSHRLPVAVQVALRSISASIHRVHKNMLSQSHHDQLRRLGNKASDVC
jgi:hypothetical protein